MSPSRHQLLPTPQDNHHPRLVWPASEVHVNGIIQHVLICIWLFQFNTVFVSDSYTLQSDGNLFIVIVVYRIPLREPVTVYLPRLPFTSKWELLVWGYYSITMNTIIYLFSEHTGISIGNILGSGILGSQGMHMLRFNRF